MHNDITSINLICMYAVMAHYCGQHIAFQWWQCRHNSGPAVRPLTALLQCAAWGQRGVRGDCGLQQSAALQLQPYSATTVS